MDLAVGSPTFLKGFFPCRVKLRMSHFLVLRAMVCTSYDRFLFLSRQFLLEVKFNKKSTIGQVLHDLQRAKRVLNHVERVQ